MAEGLSYAEIARASNEALKDALIHERAKVEEQRCPGNARRAQERCREARVKAPGAQGRRTHMAEEADRQRRHFILEGVTETEPYRYPGSGGGGASEIPARNRPEHGGELRRQIGELRTVADLARDAQQAAGMEDGLGLQVEFESFPDIELAFESLAREYQGRAYWGIELLNVRHEKSSTFATVFVPDGRLDHFERLIRDYLEEKRDRAGNRRDNQRLIDAIRESSGGKSASAVDRRRRPTPYTRRRGSLVGDLAPGAPGSTGNSRRISGAGPSSRHGGGGGGIDLS